MIYNHFVDVFDRKVNDFGRERMKREVEKLEIENSKLFHKCVNATKYEEQIKNQKTKNPRIEEFILKDGAGSICQDHVRKELPVSDWSILIHSRRRNFGSLPILGVFQTFTYELTYISDIIQH